MIERISKAEDIKSLKINSNTWGFEYGTYSRRGQTVDIVLPGDRKQIKRCTFGVNKIYATNFVAVISEVIKDNFVPGPDIVDTILNKSFIENQWD
tara:strand:- start:66 stop:350 length:285 start_codon:yes stop_codon:yes gene_type:complete